MNFNIREVKLKIPSFVSSRGNSRQSSAKKNSPVNKQLKNWKYFKSKYPARQLKSLIQKNEEKEIIV